MGILEIILIGVGLAMDACAVSMTNGMCYKPKFRQVLMIALAFGIFQALMPTIGYFAGSLFAAQVEAIDHWIALVLLGFIGGKMLWDGFHHDESCPVKPFGLGMLMTQAVATSIDALAVGVSFAAVSVDILLAVVLIGVTTVILSSIAVYLGKWIGTKLNSKAEIFGGSILIFIGLKIFIEHMWLS